MLVVTTLVASLFASCIDIGHDYVIRVELAYYEKARAVRQTVVLKDKTGRVLEFFSEVNSQDPRAGAIETEAEIYRGFKLNRVNLVKPYTRLFHRTLVDFMNSGAK